MYNNEGLCGDLVSVGFIGTSYTCTDGDSSPGCGIGGTNLGTACPSPTTRAGAVGLVVGALAAAMYAFL